MNKSAKNISLLLVDDDQFDRENIKRLLATGKHASYDITMATNFEHAIDFLRDQRFEVCLIDYYLGAYTGLDLLEKIEETNANTSVIILTGQDEQYIDEQSLQAGVSDFLSKKNLNTIILERSIRYSIHHKKMSLEYEYLANHDPLTTLVNRGLFFSRLTHLTKQLERYDRHHAILYIDLDFFKRINDEYGHSTGDKVLQLFASRLRENIRTTDTAARLGGDEFAVILEEITSEHAHIAAKKILAEMKKPFIIDNITLNLSVSIGMTFFPNEDINDPKTLLKQADQALYDAKKSGRKQYRHFDKALKKIHEENTLLETELEDAIKKQNIQPYFQTQYCLTTHKIIGLEALARWHHPEKGFISPEKFIANAEKLSLISLLTESIMNQSATALLSFLKINPDLKVSINISGSECSNPHILHLVEKLISEQHIRPEQIELEVTESVLIEHPESSIEILKSLHSLGISIAIDDFGTGYSSLNYLTELPIDTLKIDMSFVQGIGINPQQETVIQVIIDLAKRFSLKLIAEGIETQAQADFLRLNGCDYGQGYLYSKPCSFSDIKNLLYKNPQDR